MSEDKPPFNWILPQWHHVWNCGMSMPVPLSVADLTKLFVYERQYGVFYVPWAKHQSAMSCLLALQHGCEDGIEVSDKLHLEYTGGTADYWLAHTPGSAFLSSVSKRIQVATGRGLTPQERRLFGDVEHVF